MRVGIIGLPMSGKSSLFRLLTGAELHARGGTKVEVRQTAVDDPRLERLAADFQPSKITPATVEFLDFPPVGGGDGQERKSCADLLAPAREADALIVVVRAFENPRVPPVHGDVDPAAELTEVVTELRLTDLEIALRRRERLEQSIPRKRGDERKELEVEHALLGRLVESLEREDDIGSLPLAAAEEKRLRGFRFLSGKPRVIVENTTDGHATATADAEAVPVAAAIELELQELDPDSRALFAEEYGLRALAREQVIPAIYRRAGRISFLTTGPTEVRAWTVRQGTRAVDAAGAIHTDLARGFIRAEVVSYADYVTDGGMSGAKERGHLRLEGKEYEVQDGDIILFRFSV